MIDIVLAFQLLIWAVLTLRFAGSQTGSAFHPLGYYLAFHGIVFVLRPFLVYYGGFEFAFYYMGFYPSDGEFVLTLVASTVGLCAFAGASWLFGYSVPYARPITDQEFSAPQRIAFLITLALLGPIAAYSAITSSGAISTEGGGDIEMYRDPSTGFAVNVNSSGYLLDAQNMIATLCIILIWLFRFRLWSFIPLLMFIAYRAFLGWGRYAIIMSVASVALLYLYRNRRRWPFLRYVVVAIPMFVLFQALGEQRDVFREMLTGKRPYSLETTGEEYKAWIEKRTIWISPISSI
jgi:hypothetical protein